jgi:hypothetical protein
MDNWNNWETSGKDEEDDEEIPMLPAVADLHRLSLEFYPNNDASLATDTSSQREYCSSIRLSDSD